MEGNVIFGEEKKQQSQDPAASVFQQPVSQPALEEPQNVPPNPPPPPIPSHSGVLGTLLKIIIPLILLVVIGFLVVTFVLPRFSNKGGSSGSVTLTYWGLWEPKSVMQPIIDEFQKENPSIKVVYEQRDIKKYKETLLTRIQEGDGPDIFRFHNSWTKTLRTTLAPLPQTVISAEEFKKQYYPVVQSDMSINGGLYGIPLSIDTLAMLVNDKILEEYGVSPPQTWEDFGNVARNVTVRNDSGGPQTYGASMGGYDNITRAPDIISVLFAQNRVDLKNPTKSDVSNYAGALKFYTNFATGRDGYGKIWDPSGERDFDAFAGGNVAMFFGYSWDVLALKAKSPDLSFSVHPMPYLVSPMTLASYWAEGVSSRGKHQKEAMLFLSYLAKKETQQKLYTLEAKTRLFGELPARRDLADSLKDNGLVYPFLSQAETAVSSYFASDTFDGSLNEQLDGYLGNAVRSVLGNTSPESATDTLLKGVSQVLSRYGIN